MGKVAVEFFEKFWVGRALWFRILARDGQPRAGRDPRGVDGRAAPP